MNVAEIFIYHTLLEDPDQMHITADGKKMYFLLKGRLVFIEAEITFNGMSDEELNRILQDAVLDSMNSH